MHPTTTGISRGLILALVLGSALVAPGPVHGARAPAVLAAAADTPPRAPRAPRRIRGPAPPNAAAAPEAGLEIPEAPNLVTPRGWFGFAFQCGDCTARTSADDSAAVWTFGSPPKVYSVEVGSPAATAGLRRGDLITAIDGVSILSVEGGRRFGAIRPGETVRWTVLREGTSRQVVARATDRPERRARVALTELRRELMRLNEVSDVEQLRREVARINRQLERRRTQELAREQARERLSSARRLRFAGVIGGTEVEVRGSGSVIVSEADDKNELVINTGESIVVIRVPEGMRKRGGKSPQE